MNWHHKLQFEFWPLKVVYAPLVIKYFFHAIELGNPFYFYLTNPGIETGGMITEPKYDILQKIPKQYIPKTKLVRLDKITPTEFPLIIKPNHGERGSKVEKIRNKKDFEQYKKDYPQDQEYIVQEYINEPFEIGIFYYRYPNEKKGNIKSIVLKDFLTVVGDGKNNLAKLIEQHDRAKKRKEYFKKRFNLKAIPKKGELFELEPVGNHCRGTIFLNGNHLISQELIDLFDNICSQIEGFYYGRFDIRAPSFQELIKGNFKVLELNGVKSEPAHIYQPRYPIIKAYQSLFEHWTIMKRIAKQNRKKGHAYPTTTKVLADYKKYKKHRKIQSKKI